MSNVRNVLVLLTALVAGVALVVILAPGRQRESIGAQVTPTPYHEGQPSPMTSPGAMTPTVYPLPAPQDPATADRMTAAGAAMIQAADGMARAAAAMTATEDPALVKLGEHWAEDAVALRERGAWMVLAATADSMVHDPDKARELNLQNLRGNGLSMEAEGQAMAAHGAEMAAEVEQLRRDGALSDAESEALTAAAKDLSDAGEALAREGARMREYAENLLRSIGQ